MSKSVRWVLRTHPGITTVVKVLQTPASQSKLFRELSESAPSREEQRGTTIQPEESEATVMRLLPADQDGPEIFAFSTGIVLWSSNTNS